MKRIVLLVLSLCFVAMTQAENIENRLEKRHQIRIGIGDWYLGKIPFIGTCLPPSENTPTPVDPIDYYLTSYNEIPHIYAQYEYRVNSWCSVGAFIDFYSHIGDELHENRFILHTNIIPTVNFTYFNRPTYSIYSGVGLGATCATYRDLGSFAGPAINVTALGFSFGKNHWFGNLEFGMFNSAFFRQKENGSLDFYMASLFDRLITASVGYSF